MRVLAPTPQPISKISDPIPSLQPPNHLLHGPPPSSSADNLDSRHSSVLSAFISTLHTCTKHSSLADGCRAHGLAVDIGLEPDIHLGNLLVNMYTKCGSRTDARDVFERMPSRDVFTWTIMMAAYSVPGSSLEALTLHRRMEHEGFEPDRVACLTILKACGIHEALHHGKQIHAFILRNKTISVTTGNTLIDMYVKCGCIENAWKVFDTMPNKDSVSWNIMIGGCASLGHTEEAFSFFKNMEKEGFVPDQVTFLAILKACTTVTQGKLIHAYLQNKGLTITAFIGNTFIDLYLKCESLLDARQIFDEMHERDTLTFTMLISGYVKHKFMQEPMLLFWRMVQEGMFPNEFTFVNTLNACVEFYQGNIIHLQYMESHLSPNIVLENSLIDMYAKRGSLEDARIVFDQMPDRDIVSWNTIITGYAGYEQGEEAFVLFWKLEETNLQPDCATYLSILKACTCLGSLECSYLVHIHTIERNFGMDVYLESSFVDVYAKCGSINDAQYTFDGMLLHDVVAWNTIMTGYAQSGESDEVFRLFGEMEAKGVKADASSVLNLLKACVKMGYLEHGRQVHALTIEDGFEVHVYLSVSLIDLYIKSDNKEDALKVFKMMKDHDTVSWNAIITGYAEREYSEEAIKLYDGMQLEQCHADTFTFVGILKACATLAMLDKGKGIHNDVLKKGLENNVYVGCSLVDMYGKCGSIQDAHLVFQRTSDVDVVLWNAMMAAYALYGLPKEAIEIHHQMNQQNSATDVITSVNILSACSHAGLILEGFDHFKSITNPALDQYVCMVDLFGRVGLLQEASRFIESIPIQPCPVLWTALLGACKALGNIRLGHFAAKSALELDPNDITILQICTLYYQQDTETYWCWKTFELIEKHKLGSEIECYAYSCMT